MSAGRPSKYKKEYDEQVYKLALLGLTDVEMADVLGVVESTFHLWKQKHPSFSESIQKGKEPADAEVAASLYKRAKGYTVTETKVEVDQETGKTKNTVTDKHIVPDTAAAFIWLKNRRSAKWRDKQVHEHEHKGLEGLLGSLQSTKGPPGER